MAILSTPLWDGAAQADPYYNSSETGCDGLTSTVLLCEDMETRGDGTTGTAPNTGAWFEVPDNNRTHVMNKGWSPDPSSITNREVTCGAGVTPFGNCAGQTGNQPQHYFKTPTCGGDGDERCPVPEVYVRWYMKLDSSITFGQHKHMNITNGDGDIAFLNIQLNCGGPTDGSVTSPLVSIQITSAYGWLRRGGATGIVANNSCNDPESDHPELNPPDGRIGGGNTSLSLTRGRWYFMELHVIVGSSAVIEYWANDCGTTASFDCGASPTRLVNTTGVLNGNANGSEIETIWPENWCAGCSNNNVMYDNIKVSTTGPIGFSGAEPGGGETGTMALFLRGLALFHLAGTGFFLWQRRAEVMNLYATGHEMVWMWRWKRAVKRWQAQAPIMLPAPVQVMTIEQPHSRIEL